MNRFQPLLSAKIFSTKPGETQKNLDSLAFPLGCSIKYDGIRVLEYGGQMVTRSLKPLRNYYIAAKLRELIQAARERGVKGLDGEVVVGPENDPNAMQNTSSGLMSYDGTPEFTFLLFDTYQHSTMPFNERYDILKRLVADLRGQFPWLKLVEQVTIHNMEDFLAYEEEVLAQGYEGIMARKLDGRYKMGRSTMREGILMALKRFVDDVAIILEYRPELENTNPATENALGHTERSGHRENLIPKASMGTMLCRSLLFDETFWLGGGRGMTHALRAEMYHHPERFQWKVGAYTYQDIGVKKRPRLPRWHAFRSWEDLDPQVRARLLALAEAHVFSGEGWSALDPEHRPQL